MAVKIQWPRQEIDVVAAHLDPQNVRLGFTTPVSQAQIINDLFENEDAIEIVESIRTAGYFSQEAPIATRENDAVVILEGNRRVAALKALLNPSIVPKFESRVRAAIVDLGGNVSELQRVPVDMAPDRDAAQQVIASIHTLTTRKAWPTLRQAAFYYAQIEAGKRSASELASDYPNVDIPYFLRMWEIHRVAMSATYRDPEVAKFAASRRFPISTLERIYRAPEVQGRLKFSFTPLGELKVDSDPAKFAAAIGSVVEGINDKSINSRTLNDKGGKGFADLVQRLPSLPKAAKASGVAQFAPPPPTRSAPKQTSIVPKGFSSRSVHPGVTRRLSELSALNASRFPHASIDMTRTLLECSLKAYFDDVSDPIPAGKGGFVMLSNALDHAVQHFTTVNKVKRLAQLSRSIRDGVATGTMPISEILNAANHNYSTVYVRQDAQDCWDKIQDLMAEILNPPVSP